MLHLLEALGRFVAHPLGGAVGAAQLRVGLLQLQQLPIQPVVDRIFHHRRIEHVVGVGGAVEQISQFSCPLPLSAGLVRGAGGGAQGEVLAGGNHCLGPVDGHALGRVRSYGWVVASEVYA